MEVTHKTIRQLHWKSDIEFLTAIRVLQIFEACGRVQWKDDGDPVHEGWENCVKAGWVTERPLEITPKGKSALDAYREEML